MIENWLFILPMFAVLLIPGPTNALLASAAHTQGVVKTAYFIPAEWLGYIYGIALWSIFIHLTSPIWPFLIPALHTLSTLYVLWLAFRLWKSSQLKYYGQTHKHYKPYHLFVSTLKNPKTLLFAAGIFPETTWDNVQNALMVLGIFTAAMLPVSCFWMLFGRRLLSNQVKGFSADHLYKGSAMLLVICMLPLVFKFF